MKFMVWGVGVSEPLAQPGNKSSRDSLMGVGGSSLSLISVKREDSSSVMVSKDSHGEGEQTESATKVERGE